VPQDVVEVVGFDMPPLGPGQVLVRVMAAPINPSDLLTITGQYGVLPPLPAVPGNEGAGQVVETGPGVAGLKPGQPVLLPVGAGSWATHMVADASLLLPLPENADLRQMSMLAINPPTAQLLLSEFVDLQPGEWIIQNAANSAVGGYITQIAKNRGIKTVNIVRRSSAEASVLENSGDVVLVDGDDLPGRVRRLSGAFKIRLGIDAVGGESTGRLAACLARGGTLINYGAMSGQACRIPPSEFIFRDISLRGFWLSRWFSQAGPQRQLELFTDLMGQITAGKLKARILATFGIGQIREALAAAAAGDRDGKILIEP